MEGSLVLTDRTPSTFPSTTRSGDALVDAAMRQHSRSTEHRFWLEIAHPGLEFSGELMQVKRVRLRANEKWYSLELVASLIERRSLWSVVITPPAERLVAKYRYYFEVEYEVVRLLAKAPYVKVIRSGSLREPTTAVPAPSSPMKKLLLSLRSPRTRRTEAKFQRPLQVFQRSSVTSVTAFGEVATWVNPWNEAAPSPWAQSQPHPMGSDVGVHRGFHGPMEIIIANYGASSVTLESLALLGHPAVSAPVSQYWSILHDPTAAGPVSVAPGATATILLNVVQLDYPEATLDVAYDGGVQRYWLEAWELQG